MNGLIPEGMAGTIATWVAALVTIAVWAYLVGERRLFRLAQHLLAGLATGYLVLLAVREVLLPRLVDPILAGTSNVLLWAALLPVAAMIGAAWLPRRVAAIPIAVLVAATAAFALGGAVAGTLMPQLGAALVAPGQSPAALIGAATSALITILVLLAFLHGAPRTRLVAACAGVGRWLLIGGIGGWLGFLLVSRLGLLVDRVAFLLNGWLGLGR
ncbi:MAG TPA: hypothetical protein VHU77_07125 [Candidatus Limnocylindria bacterium]|nr:hypothetical protein [Candidatus Limnocylindria bacterium]